MKMTSNQDGINKASTNEDNSQNGDMQPDLQIVVKLSNEVPRNILGSQKVWVIFHENETFLGHFSKK